MSKENGKKEEKVVLSTSSEQSFRLPCFHFHNLFILGYGNQDYCKIIRCNYIVELQNYKSRLRIQDILCNYRVSILWTVYKLVFTNLRNYYIYSQTGRLFLQQMALLWIFAYRIMPWRDLNPTRVAPDWDLWRILYWPSYSAGKVIKPFTFRKVVWDR